MLQDEPKGNVDFKHIMVLMQCPRSDMDMELEKIVGRVLQ